MGECGSHSTRRPLLRFELIFGCSVGVDSQLLLPLSLHVGSPDVLARLTEQVAAAAGCAVTSGPQVFPS